MCEVTPMRQVEAQYFIVGLETSQHHGGIGLRTGVRLNISPFGAEKFFGPVDRQLFNLINYLAAPIITLAW